MPADSYVGFTAANTADHREIHEIISWQFSHNQATNSSLLAPNSTLPSTSSTSKPSKGLIVGVGIGAALLVLALSIVGMGMRRYMKHSANPKVVAASSHLDAVNFGPRRLRYAELRVATDNFSDERLLGKGGFGSVYKGSLLGFNDNQEVAIKRISQNSTQGEREFEAEVLSIGRLRHRNLVPLLGWCHEEQELLLVYEFMANGSLDQHLYSKKSCNAALSWESRFQILKSVAAALDYLHNGWEQCILHRDIKPSNVMLDFQMNARLGDFGLARLAGHGEGTETTVMSHCTNVVGTVGYIAPVSNCYQAFTPKSDVYSFGIMVLEVVCRRLPHNPVEEEDNLVRWVWSMHKQGQLLDVIDGALQMKTDEVVQQVMHVLHLGMLCTLPDPSLRPRTEKLLPALKGDCCVSLPASRTGVSPLSSTSSVHNSSKSESMPLVSND